jgi:hypothetical protein
LRASDRALRMTTGSSSSLGLAALIRELLRG